MAPRFSAPWDRPRVDPGERGLMRGHALLVAGLVYALLAVTALAVLAAVPEGALAPGPLAGFEGIPGRVRAALEMGASLVARPSLLAGVWLGTAFWLTALGLVARRSGSSSAR